MKSSFRVLLLLAVMIQLGCSVSVTGPSTREPQDPGGELIPNSASGVIFSEPGASLFSESAAVVDGGLYGLYYIKGQGDTGIFAFAGKLGAEVKKRKICDKCVLLLPRNGWTYKGLLRQRGVFYRIEKDKAIHYVDLGSWKDRVVADEGNEFFLNQNQVVTRSSTFGMQFYDLATDERWTLDPLVRTDEDLFDIVDVYYDKASNLIKALGISKRGVFIGRSFKNFQLELQFKKVSDKSFWGSRTFFLNDGSVSFLREDPAYQDPETNEMSFNRFDYLTDQASSYLIGCPKRSGFTTAQSYKGFEIFICRDVYRNIEGTIMREVEAPRTRWESVVAMNDQWAAYVNSYGPDGARSVEIKNKAGEVIWIGEKKDDMGYRLVPDALYSTISDNPWASDLHLSDLVLITTRNPSTRQATHQIMSLSTKRSIALDPELAAMKLFALPKGKVLAWNSQKGELLWLNLSRELYAH